MNFTGRREINYARSRYHYHRERDTVYRMEQREVRGTAKAGRITVIYLPVGPNIKEFSTCVLYTYHTEVSISFDLGLNHILHM